MKSFFNSKYFLLIFTAAILFNCSKAEQLPENIEVHNFIWRGLNAFYLWQDEVPDLQDDRFSNQSQLNSFLGGFDEPRDLFDELIVSDKDDFSFLVEDRDALVNSQQGSSLNNGMEFGLKRYADNSNNVYGYVRYVIPDSDAAAKGITRGMIFNTIDGTQITIENSKELLNNPSYTVGFANFNAGNPVANGQSITLLKTQLTENPVAIASVINNGGKNIGYLSYNKFISNFDGELNAAFGNFRAQGVTELIVDLRYNPGGFVSTARHLASMITGQFTDQLFSRKIWNTKFQENFSEENFIDNFTDQIRNTDNNGNIILDEPINSLNLTKVYFIVTGNSASASELVINSLRSYIDVVLVGNTTVGKVFGSVTLFDSDNLLTRTGNNFNTNHTYAMQPIVSETVNNEGDNAPDGFTPGGLLPGTLLDEDMNNLGILGDINEPLLAETLRLINGTLSKRNTKQKTISKNNIDLYSSKLALPTGNNMYIDLK